jgi:hypothetical protein
MSANCSRHEIAVMQTTAVEQRQIILTTLLVHASGEWVSSLWPVCPATEPSAQVKGAALTHARRYALFSLVGIAGEDDLDAPELAQQAGPSPEPPRAANSNKGRLHSPRPPALASEDSAKLRDHLLNEIATIDGDEALALWAYRSLPAKNTLTTDDTQAVEAAYLARLAPVDRPEPNGPALAGNLAAASDSSAPLPLAKPLRRRSKAHLAFVASQPCLICKVTPCDAHHLKIAQPRSLAQGQRRVHRAALPRPPPGTAPARP